MKNIIKSRIFYFVLGAIIFTTVGAYAATIIASEIPYTNNDQENVQGAIDDLYDKIESHCPNGKACINKSDAKGLFPICKRATTLHNDGTNTFGKISESGLNSGDAFDCDVNLDGTYDSNKERFYYVSEYYNTSTKQFENDTAVLIYYNNVSNGIPDYTKTYAYNSSASNTQGPQAAKLGLPTIEQWPNVQLKNINRQILTETGLTYSGGGKLPNSYSYEGYAARLITTQEINIACNITIGNRTFGELNVCSYLMENTKYSNNNYAYGYWLETPVNTRSSWVWYIRSHWYHDVADSVEANTENINGVRPVIEVPITDIEY